MSRTEQGQIGRGGEALPKKVLSNAYPELEQRVFEVFGHHAALNYCGPLPRLRFA